ncbi:SWIM zinc finger family protein [Streptomyces sp. NRRL B-24484]|uniref:SWIM zinc finger family protein n=1 Tax=Streptomyces sp. NRRL B-24484 TaxID=1463833 RepID=UPI000A9F863C|nr:SWIM zinc finger family protein [Streptomyces sp. NRRL B-24484]
MTGVQAMTAAEDLQLPPVAPEVLAAAVESLTSRLRKKLDAAIEQYAALPVAPAADGPGVGVRCGEDAVVTLLPGPDGAVTEEGQARCSCLLAPRCLHRAAVLGCCPIADPPAAGAAAPAGPAEQAEPDAAPATTAAAGTAGAEPAPAAAPEPPATVEPTPAQVQAAAGLWAAAAAALAAGVPAAGAVPQAELLRAAHTARLADLHRAEAAALRVVRGLRSARARYSSHRTADLAAALRELLLTTALLRSGPADRAVLGTARRAYKPGGALRVHGVCREPVLTATGYGGVVTHLVTEDGRWVSIADIKPGGPSRARGAGTAPVSVGAAALDHSQLSRGGLLISGATVSADGRLGSGRGVRANPVGGMDWGSGPLAELFARPLAEAVAERLADGPLADPEQTELLRRPVGCELVVLGASADSVLAREVDGTTGEPHGPLVRLVAVNRHPDLAHTANLTRIGAHPGLRLRVLARVDPDRAATLRPLAVAPVAGAAYTLRLPAEWQGRADLGYDLLQGTHVPAPDGDGPQLPGPVSAGPDPLGDSPLWRVRRQVELAVAGGRRAVAEAARSGGARTDAAALRRTGFRTAAGLSTALAEEADRRQRDVFGRLGDPNADRYAEQWLAAALHLTAAERELVRATWHVREAAAG